MKRNLFSTGCLLGMVIIQLVSSCNSTEKQPEFVYPESKTVDSSDNYFGNVVADPYRWMEAGTSPEVVDWVKRQQAFTEQYIASLPNRTKIKERLTQIWSYARMSAPFKKNGKTFYYKNDGTQNHSVLYLQDSSGVDRVVIDPNKFSEDGTVALSSTSISKDGMLLAYAKSAAGSDWKTIEVLNIETGELLPDKLEWVKFSGISWKGNGFFYSRYNAPKEGKEFVDDNAFHRVYFHKVGTMQSEDILIYDDPANSKRNFGLGVSEDQTVFTLSGSETTSGNSMLIGNATNWKPGDKIDWKVVAESFEADIWLVSNDGKRLLFMTNYKAPNYKLVSITWQYPSLATASNVIAESEHVLENVQVANGKLIAQYLKNVQTSLVVTEMDGKPQHEIELPGIGIVDGISAEKEEADMYFSFVNYTMPSSIYKYNMESKEQSLHFKPTIDFDSDNYETKQVFYSSKDGTKIPMFITHKKGLVVDGNNPVFLFGYGGFNISYTPEFRVDRTVFLENDGIYCVPNIRGGGEFGEDWHIAGTKLKKQNVFDDFIAAAEYLIREGYTNPDKLAIHGRSNGGLLIGACITQRPDLFKVAIPKVGVLDMLRFHKFTIGWAWVVDYGSSDVEEEFNYLMNYSPVHNVKPASYPATIVVTGDHDDRVVPSHSFKFIAQLQSKQQGPNPVIIRIDTAAGHGSGKPIAKQIDEFSDTWTFVFHHLGMNVEAVK